MTELMSGALELTVVGMGFVFTFLILLVAVMTMMSAVLTRFAPETPVAPATRRQQPQARAPAQVDADTAEAIRLAISKYRARHK